MKEEIFSKFKDFNRELEKILETKDFSKNAKNLLLSLFYKIETSYNDYAIVKRKVKTKHAYLTEILQNIQKCKKIELILPNTKEYEELKKRNILHETDFINKKIKAFANEIELLYAIFELNDFKIFLNEKYNLVRNAFPYLLNLANDMNNVEVLSDFNAWSWNTQKKSIIDLRVNLIYENIKLLLNFDILERAQNDTQFDDILVILSESMTALYGTKNTDDFFKLLFKISIMIYIQKSEIEQIRLKNEKKDIIEELEQIKNKTEYIERITKEKKQLINEVKRLDLIVNDKNMLTKEFNTRNNKLPENKKIFSISDLEEKIRREKNRLLRRIDICNFNLQPNNYIEKKKQIQKDYSIIKDIDFEKINNNEQLYKTIYKFQILFIKLLFIKLEKTEQKQELIDMFYEFRYYILLPYNDNILVCEKDGLNSEISKFQDELIRKLYVHKVINTMSTNEEADIKIIKNILSLRTIYLEGIYIELVLKNKEYYLNVYEDKETPEESIKVDVEFNKKDKIRLNKKIKLFI